MDYSTLRVDLRQWMETEPLGVWLSQRDGRIVFVCRDMWEWMKTA